ncbi:MAG: FtsX-like permease family protein [Corynebacterium sp.]|nr:FtsX-like permease family protein [Corynebacterium sp.]
MGRHDIPQVKTPSGRATMLKLSIRSILAHKLRLLLSVVAVMLGTAFVAGSMMFTTSLNTVFDSAIEDAFDGVDAVITPDPAAAAAILMKNPADLKAMASLGGVRTSLIEELRHDPEIKNVAIHDGVNLVLANANREPYQTRAGRVQIVSWYDDTTAVGVGNKLIDGHLPENQEQIVINAQAAKAYNIKIGDTVVVVDPQHQKNMIIVGTFEPVKTGGELGSNITLSTNEKEFLELYTNGKNIKSLAVEGNTKHGADLITYLSEKYPGVKYQPGSELADTLNTQIKDGLKFVNYFLVAFGLIALLVGTFIIANTFAMIVAQRLKEFALMRALGVSRRQLTTSVVIEAFLVGLLGSGIGIGLGVGLVQLIQLVLEYFNMSISGAGLGLTTTSVAVPLGLGTFVTLLSAWAPARRAGAVHPVEAMRSTESASESPLKLRTFLGFLVLAAGCACAAAGVMASVADYDTQTRALAVGVGAVAVVLGVFMISPALSILVVGIMGRIIGLPFRAVGKLAATNSRRNPRRTATTAFALTLGVALVTTIGMLSATMQQSVKDLVSSGVRADFVLSSPANGQFPVPEEAVQKVRSTAGVGEVVGFAQAPVVIGVNVDPAAAANGMVRTLVADNDISKSVDLEGVNGSLNLQEPNVFVAFDDYASQHGWKIGDTVPVKNLEGKDIAQAKLIGTYGENRMMGDVELSAATLANTPYAQEQVLTWLMVTGDGSVSQSQLRENLQAAVKDYLVVQVQDKNEYAGQRAGMINQMLYILYALLALSVLVAILGIVNTLALNVIERRQEIGMLRAVGMQRRQIRRLITIESVQIALYGAAVGIGVGVGVGWSFLTVLSEEGLGTLVIPWVQLAWMFGASAVVGVIAAWWPAGRAAKTPPLDAIAA